VTFTTTFTSPHATRRSIATAVNDALRTADYLLVTSPINLTRSFGEADAAEVLVNMAELATWRNGALGYFHGSGLIRTGYRTGDLLALGDLFTSHGAQDEVFVGSVAHDRIQVHAETREVTMEGGVALSVDLRAGDSVAIGNFRTDYEADTNAHHLPEIVVALGDAHDRFERGRLLIHQYGYTSNSVYTVHELLTSYASGGRIAKGFIIEEDDDGRDEIVMATPDGSILGHGRRGVWAIAE
jgi:hypothetical protein